MNFTNTRTVNLTLDFSFYRKPILIAHVFGYIENFVSFMQLFAKQKKRTKRDLVPGCCKKSPSYFCLQLQTDKDPLRCLTYILH